MIVSKTDIEAYINFISKAIGQKKGYKKTQRQEIIQQFSVASFTNLESLLDTLKYLLETGESPNDFSLEDIQQMLAHSPEQNEQANAQEEYERLQTSLVVIPEDFKQTIFVINDIMTKFLYKYPGTVVWQMLISSWKERLKNLVSNFFR
jgi:tRNA U34 5-carboxymethylaminomethyl modifying GTPase MnmE/TrmE